MDRKLLLALIACAGFSLASSAVALADDTSTTTQPTPKAVHQATPNPTTPNLTAATAPKSEGNKSEGRLALEPPLIC